MDTRPEGNPPIGHSDADELREIARAWVRQTCAEQGIQVRVHDPLTVRNIAILLRPIQLSLPNVSRPDQSETDQSGVGL